MSDKTVMSVSTQANQVQILDDFGQVVADMADWGAAINARRFVAAWNVCRGIPVEVLEAQQSGGLPWRLADQIEARVVQAPKPWRVSMNYFRKRLDALADWCAGKAKWLLAFLAGLIVGGLACIADCRAQIIGVNLVTAHTGGGYRWDTPGLYVRRDDGLTLGALRNSLGRTSLHLSQTWERGPWAVQAGAITGYPMAPVVPLLTGSVLIGNHHRLILIPGPRGRMALHYALEWQ